MADRINNLPLEIILMILSHLPLHSLVSFGETSRANYVYHVLSLKRLRLAVFRRRIHSVISFLQAGWVPGGEVTSANEENEAEAGYTISVLQPWPPSAKKNLDYRPPFREGLGERSSSLVAENHPKSLEQMVRIQNELFTKLLYRYGKSLVQLEFMAYDMNIAGAVALGTCCQQKLRHLALRFEHPHVRDGLMRPMFWLKPAPSSTAWNALIGIGPYRAIGIRTLETLVLERAGITPWQLMTLVNNNPGLTTLKLRTCTGAQPDFLNWLGGVDGDSDDGAVEKKRVRTAPGARLKVLWLENCQQIIIPPASDLLEDDENHDFGLQWVNGLTNLESLSFSECISIPSEYIDRVNKTTWKIPEVILPFSLPTEDAVIEVDPNIL